MSKIPLVPVLVIVLFFSVSCKQAMDGTTSKGYSENFSKTATVSPYTTLDANETFEIHLPIKDGFVPYVSTDITSVNEFEHSEYMLMVRASKYSFTSEPIPMFTYSFLGENVICFEDGSAIYNKLNSIYSKQYPSTELPDTYFHQGNIQMEAAKDYFFSRNVLFVSSDAKRVLCHSLLFGGMLTRTLYDGSTVEREGWNRLIEIYDGKESVYEKMYIDNDPNQSAPYVYDFFINRSLFDINGFIIDNDIIINYDAQSMKNVNKGDKRILHVPNSTNKFIQVSDSQNEISIHGLSDGDRLATIKIPSNFVISQFTNDDRIVALYELKAPSYGYDPEEFYAGENIYSNDTYIMNIDGSNAKYIGNYMFSPYISPDGKYIAYTGLSGTDHQEYSNEFNNLADMKDGFYIKSLETNQTVYYPVEKANEYNIIGWVSKKGLDNLIN